MFSGRAGRGRCIFLRVQSPVQILSERELTIKPQIHSFFYTFEADMYSFSTHVIIQIKVFDIRAYRIVLCF